jgi:hypothetical protein
MLSALIVMVILNVLRTSYMCLHYSPALPCPAHEMYSARESVVAELILVCHPVGDVKT